MISLFFKKRDRQTSESSLILTVTIVQHQYSETPSIPTMQIPSISFFQNEYHSSPNLDLQSSSIERDSGKRKKIYECHVNVRDEIR